MYTFARGLAAYLSSAGVRVTRDIRDEYDILFVNSWAVPFEDVENAKRQRPDVRVVQRVDGSSQDYGGYRHGDRLQARVNLLADLTIFQSAYSKYSTREKYRVIAQDGPIIFNPADLATFTPDGPRLGFEPGRLRVACASWSLNPGKGTHALDRLAADLPTIDFVLCGRFEGIAMRPNVIRLGHLPPVRMAEAFRSCDVFLNLSLNDPAPNVVIEALASGLPVLYLPSGGVGELVGPAGLAIAQDDVRGGLAAIMRDHDALARQARLRAETIFAPGEIFGQYLNAMRTAPRQPLPASVDVARLWLRGYPVWPAPRRSRPATPSRAVVRRARTRPYRVGWVTYDSLRPKTRDFADLDSFTGMRTGNVAEWMNRNSDRLRNELYRPGRAYDAVVLQKVMGGKWPSIVRRLQRAGTLVVFDANVNYYEIWGDYDVPGTQPTDEQQRAADWLTRHADWVVADSSYLANVIQKITSRVTWIPDNINLDVYRGCKEHQPSRPLRIVWSGVSKKAQHLRMLREPLLQYHDVEFVVVSDEPPDLAWLPDHVQRRFVPFTDARYARTLLDCDVIVSPKHLSNGYEMAHTEYKIALGMAVGLPALASAQPSYVEAIEHRGGGLLARTPFEWVEGLRALSNRELRGDLGARAAATVRERYSTAVVAAQYHALLETLLTATAQPAVS
jgi:glycosyltransferase involved in cell wall biosynthesis